MQIGPVTDSWHRFQNGQEIQRNKFSYRLRPIGWSLTRPIWSRNANFGPFFFFRTPSWQRPSVVELNRCGAARRLGAREGQTRKRKHNTAIVVLHQSKSRFREVCNVPAQEWSCATFSMQNAQRRATAPVGRSALSFQEQLDQVQH